MKVSSLQAEGVVLLPSSHPVFMRALRPGVAKEFEPLLSYATAIQNNADRSIIAYAVMWTTTDFDGTVRTGGRVVDNFTNLDAGTNLKPRETRIVAPGFGLEAGLTKVDALTRTHIDDLIKRYSDKKAVSIDLDAVLFDDGEAVGPDRNGWVSRWRAWLDAEKEVFAAAAEVSDLNRSSSMRAYIFQAGASSAEMGVRADHASGYEECLKYARAYFAQRIMEQMTSGNSEATMNEIRRMLAFKPYPIVHRTGGK